MNVRELRSQRASILDQAVLLVETAEGENRDLKAEEQTTYDDLVSQAESLEKRIKRLETMPAPVPAPGNGRGGAPNINRLPLGDSEVRALGQYFKTGDTGGVRDLMSQDDGDRGPSVRIHVPTALEMRANDTIMNITTGADGGSAVPTGFAGKIAARRNEVRLSERLGVQMVPGQGTTVNFPYENADPSAFAATSEQDDAYAQTYERDAPALGLKAFTLAKKTKKLALTEELLDDEDAALLAFIGDHIGRSMGITHNSLLLTEVAANGTALKTFAAAAVIAAGEPDDMVFHATLGYYLDDGSPAAWVMRPPTLGAIRKLSGNARIYDDQTGAPRKSLLEYPVLYSNAAAAIAASAKSLYFGNWFYVGMREDPALRFIRDPYTTDGIVYLKYTFRAVYGVLIAGAIGYGVHPSA
ncbi:MAG TPA: phage major capsid protein [Anaerolineales bacterium]|nr:phage major capsid protein [Anaerolineales bacterium]